MTEQQRTRMVIIRHGESVAVVERLVSGHRTCRGLTPAGRRQAEALRDRLLRTGELREASFLYTSILPRAIETAEIIVPGVGEGTLVPDRRCELCEIHVGEGEGLSWEEFSARYGEVDRRVPLSPGGESVDSFLERAGAALRTLASEHDGRTVVVVAHGGIVLASLHTLGGMEDGERTFDLWVENTGLTVWSRPAGDDGRWRLDVHNDVAHLAGA